MSMHGASGGAAGEGDEDWVLRAKMQLCGAVAPPTYADLRTDAHLNTFDVSEGGAALLGERGQLFLVNLFQQAPKQSKSGAAGSSGIKASQMLTHVALEPPLQPQEVAEVEQLKLNASATQVLLLAKNWVKVVRLPAEAAALGRSAAAWKRGAGGSSGAHKPGRSAMLQRASLELAPRFTVRFEDGDEQVLELSETPDENESIEALAERVKRLSRAGAQGKRVAFVSRELCVASVRAVGYFSGVRHAAWHVLSDAHVVVLSDAEELAVFNTQQDVSKPEQRHLLDYPTKGRVTGAISTSFCFGSPLPLTQQTQTQTAATQLWDTLTCYVLRSDGAVYALCPLVPYDCRVSRVFIQTLRSEVDARIALCKHKLERLGDGELQSRLVELKSHKYWLQEAWAPASAHAPRSSPRLRGSYTSTTDKTEDMDSDMMCFLRPHVSGISPDTWPLALQGPVDMTPKSVVEGKNQVAGGSAATSLLLVPQAVRSAMSGDKRASAAPFLLRAFTSGHVELLLLDAPLQPHWKSNRQVTTTPCRLPALLLECLHLGIDDSGGKAVLERDAADPRLVYCLHSTGVHVLNVSWVFALAAGKQFSTLPKSSVRHVFSVSPSSSSTPSSSSAVAVTTDSVVPNVVGARVVKNVNFGHLLLLRLASGSFEVVNVSAASSELLKGVLVDNGGATTTPNRDVQPHKTLPGTLASMASSKSRAVTAVSSTKTSADGGLRPLGDMVEEKLEALTARGTRVTGNTLMHEVDDAVLAFVLERVKILYEDVQYIDEMDQLMRDRLQVHGEMLKAQTEKAVAVQKSADEARAALQKLQDKMARALAVQQNLRKRAAAVLQAVKENQPHLSRAEREFKSELDLMSVEVRRMKPRVTQLTVLGQRAVRSLENAALSASASSRYGGPMGSAGATTLSNEKKKMCYDVLRAETQLIDDTKVLLDDLTANLQQLKE